MHLVADGPAVTVTASITDAAGNTGSASRIFIKDTVAPVLTFTSPAAGPIPARTNTSAVISS